MVEVQYTDTEVSLYTQLMDRWGGANEAMDNLMAMALIHINVGIKVGAPPRQTNPAGYNNRLWLRKQDHLTTNPEMEMT